MLLFFRTVDITLPIFVVWLNWTSCSLSALALQLHWARKLTALSPTLLCYRKK